MTRYWRGVDARIYDDAIPKILNPTHTKSVK